MASNNPFIPGSSLPKSARPLGERRHTPIVPFVPGQRSQIHLSQAPADLPPAEEGVAADQELPFITEFLAEPKAANVGPISAPQVVEELPSIDDFLLNTQSKPVSGEIPQVVATQRFESPQLTPSIQPAAIREPGPAEEGAPVQEPHEVVAQSRHPQPEETWIQEEWKRFDWQAAAAMGRERSEDVQAAESAWDEDWDSGRPNNAARATRAESIASALNKIAQRVRSGSLKVEGTQTETEEAALAATLAALLNQK